MYSSGDEIEIDIENGDVLEASPKAESNTDAASARSINLDNDENAIAQDGMLFFLKYF